MNRNLAVRLATAAVAVPIILWLLYLGPVWSLFPVAMIATLIGAWELFGMTHHGDRFGRVVGLVLSATASATAYFYGHDHRVLIALMAVVALGVR